MTIILTWDKIFNFSISIKIILKQKKTTIIIILMNFLDTLQIIFDTEFVF